MMIMIRQQSRGAIVAQSVKISGNSRFHYDEDLRKNCRRPWTRLAQEQVRAGSA